MQSVEHMPLARAERFFTSTTNRLVLAFGFMSIVLFPIVLLRHWDESKTHSDQTSERFSFVRSKSVELVKRILVKGPVALASFIDAWQVFGFVYEFPSLLRAIDITYTGWGMAVATIWISCFVLKFESAKRRYQFCLAIILLWFFGGNILATIMSTAGPCYYEHFFNDPTYAAMMTELAAIHEDTPLNAVSYHDVLMNYYQDPSYRMGGISAMPSLHNATSTLFMLAAYRIHKIFGHVMLAFLFCIIIGSVHLAWHYAVDAYAGILIALIMWKLSGWALSWQDKRLSSRTPT